MSEIEKLLPYIRLLKTGEFTNTKTTEKDAGKCVKLRWANRSRRKNHITITELGKEKIPEFLANMWSDWESYADDLITAGFELTVDGVYNFEYRCKLEHTQLPAKIHHKTLASCGGKHSKTGTSRRLQNFAGSSIVTTDQILRIRTNQGLVIKHAGYGEMDCDHTMLILGEVAIPERAFIDGIIVTGKIPKMIFTIENRGSYIDFPNINSDILLIHAPGDDTALAIKFLKLFPKNVVYYHFGDIDPKGLKIALSLRKHAPQTMQLFVPKFWAEYAAEMFVGRKQWSNKNIPNFGSDVIRTLQQEGKWMEQERIMLDARFEAEINNLLQSAFPSSPA
jgi:hypothetical protein